MRKQRREERGEAEVEAEVKVEVEGEGEQTDIARSVVARCAPALEAEAYTVADLAPRALGSGHGAPRRSHSCKWCIPKSPLEVGRRIGQRMSRSPGIAQACSTVCTHSICAAAKEGQG